MPYMGIHNDLFEAYEGYYEKELEKELRPKYDAYVEQERKKGAIVVEAWEGWIKFPVAEKIKALSPKERLAIYLEWNGILGWTNRIWELSQGEL